MVSRSSEHKKKLSALHLNFLKNFEKGGKPIIILKKADKNRLRLTFNISALKSLR